MVFVQEVFARVKFRDYLHNRLVQDTCNMFNMADKHAKLATRKTKKNNHDLTLQDVLALGGDKVRCIQHNFSISLS